tara:strand:+ start:376 stop:1056 length:681 start_codon:yes stop_codon:yes gene_type:complete
MSILSFTPSSVESLDELVKNRRKRERRERRALERLKKNEADIHGNEMVKQFREFEEAQSFLNYKFNTKGMKEEFINNSNKEKIIYSGLSDIIQKDILYPAIKNYSLGKVQNRIFKSLSHRQKKTHYNYIKALSIMVYGDSFLVEDWKNMFLLFFLARQGKIRFQHLLLSKTTYRVWKVEDNGESVKWLSKQHEEIEQPENVETDGNVIYKTNDKEEINKEETDGNK